MRDPCHNKPSPASAKHHVLSNMRFLISMDEDQAAALTLRTKYLKSSEGSAGSQLTADGISTALGKACAITGLVFGFLNKKRAPNKCCFSLERPKRECRARQAHQLDL